MSQQNRDFISARLNEDSALQPYLDTIERSLYPDVLRSQPLCLGEARRAISTYRKATRDARGVLELRLRLLECGTAYAADFGALDERLANTLSVTLEEILAAASLLTASDQHAIFGRLHRVAHTARTLGWGHYDLIDQSLATARRPPTNQS